MNDIKQFIPQPTRGTHGTGRQRLSFQVSYPTLDGRKPMSISYLPERDGDIEQAGYVLARRLGMDRSKMIREAVDDLYKLITDEEQPSWWAFPARLEQLADILYTTKSGAVITAIRWRESLSSKIKTSTKGDDNGI